jgi:hypothetical protein
MGVRPCGDAHFTESVYDQKTAQASVRLKTKVWNPKKRQSMRPIFFTKQGIFESRFFQSRMLGKSPWYTCTVN